jgi:uncharacterized protein (DUF433 family)
MPAGKLKAAQEGLAMSLEGTVQDGVIVLDPGSPPLAEGTRVEVAPRTGMEPLINKLPGVCGGDAIIGLWRIPVWLLENARRGGASVGELLEWYPGITQAQVEAAFRYATDNTHEIEQAIRENIV